jgi:hypothetical protein
VPQFIPQLSRILLGATGVEVRLGHELVDDYLRFVSARCRPNSVLAAGYDLKVFFTVVAKDPLDVTMTDVFEFITAQRLPTRGGNVVRIELSRRPRVLARALDLTNFSASISDETKFEFLVGLGRAQSYRGDAAASDRAFAAAADVARAAHDSTRLATAALGDDWDTRALTPSPARMTRHEEALRALGEEDSVLHVSVASAYVAMGSLSRGAAGVRELADETVERPADSRTRLPCRRPYLPGSPAPTQLRIKAVG